MSRKRKTLLTLVIAGIAAAGLASASPAGASVSACKSGYYENVYGNCVPRPTQSPSKPSGATAKCRDGTYSFSQSHSGTCSHHGGVATWYRIRSLAVAA
jgi:hypothetical protein